MNAGCLVIAIFHTTTFVGAISIAPWRMNSPLQHGDIGV